MKGVQNYFYFQNLINKKIEINQPERNKKFKLPKFPKDCVSSCENRIPKDTGKTNISRVFPIELSALQALQAEGSSVNNPPPPKKPHVCT